MGQYYMPTVISDTGVIQTLYSHSFDNGLKLMEHSWIGNEFVNAVYSLIYKKPHRVAWIGDYSDTPYEGSRDYYASLQPYEAFMRYYTAAWHEESERISKQYFSSNDMSIITNDTEKAYLINRDYGEYIDLGEYIKRALQKDGYCVNPLPLLTACGNDRGGGDFHKKATAGYDFVGLWAFSKLELTDTEPLGLEKMDYLFIEN